jgi:hypothetical protein
VSATDDEWVDVSGGLVIGFLGGLRLNGNLNLKVEEIHGWTLADSNMIEAVKLSPEEFRRSFPPGGKGRISGSPTNVGHSILNDIPLAAMSCLVYDYPTLKRHSGDSTYLIPERNQFENLRQLGSLEAVMIQSGGDTVFSHMCVAPRDVCKLLGKDFVKGMKDVQRDVEWMYGFFNVRFSGEETSSPSKATPA